MTAAAVEALRDLWEADKVSRDGAALDVDGPLPLLGYD